MIYTYPIRYVFKGELMKFILITLTLTYKFIIIDISNLSHFP